MNASQVKQEVNGDTYLAKNDPIYIEINKRVVSDWKASAQLANPNTEENQRKRKEFATWTPAKQEEFQERFMASLDAYCDQISMDLGSFLMFFPEIDNLQVEKFSAETDFRVRAAGDHRYIAEFWEDGLAVNSEANAIAWAKELANSPRAKLHPEEDLGNVEEIKKTYADARKAITSGKQKRYTKIMAFLYIQQPDKTIKFEDPNSTGSL